MNKIIFSQKDISTVVERMTSDEMIQGVELAPQGSKERRAPQGKLLSNMASVYLHELQNHCGW